MFRENVINNIGLIVFRLILNIFQINIAPNYSENNRDRIQNSRNYLSLALQNSIDLDFEIKS